VDALLARGIPFSFAYLFAATLQSVPATVGPGERDSRRPKMPRSCGGGSIWGRARAIVPLALPLILSSLAEVDHRSFALEARGAGYVVRRTPLNPPGDSTIERVAPLVSGHRYARCRCVENHRVTVAFEAVSFTYPAASRPALNEVSARIDPGTVTLVTGPWGAGVQHTPACAAGWLPALTGGRITGRVTTLQRDPAYADERRALAGQIGLLLPTPWTQLSGMRKPWRMKLPSAPPITDGSASGLPLPSMRAMERVGVTHLAKRKPATLSGGELQRVMFAALISMDPAVYLLDEPTLELDHAGAASLYRLLPELASSSVVILASTDLDRAVDVADRVLLLNDGRLRRPGTP